MFYHWARNRILLEHPLSMHIFIYSVYIFMYWFEDYSDFCVLERRYSWKTELPNTGFKKCSDIHIKYSLLDTWGGGKLIQTSLHLFVCFSRQSLTMSFRLALNFEWSFCLCLPNAGITAAVPSFTFSLRILDLFLT